MNFVLRVALLLLGVYACSTAVIMIKAGTVPPMLLAGYRILIAAVVLAPLLVRDLRRFRGQITWRDLAPTILPGVVLGMHFITWIDGARRTLAANAALIVTMVPIAMPFFLLAMLRERLTRGELGGTIVAMLGVAVLGASDYHVSPGHLRGDAICFGSMLLFCWYLVLARKHRHFQSIWLYVVPLYFAGGVLCLAAGLVMERGVQVTYNAKEILLIIGLAIVPTVIGHSILNYSMKHMRGQIVGVMTLTEFVFAGVMAFFFFGEIPSWAFYPAAALVLAGAIIIVKYHREQRNREDHV